MLEYIYLYPTLIVCGGSVFGPCFVALLLVSFLVFATPGDWDCMAAVERLPALHYSVDFILGSWVLLWNFETIKRVTDEA